MPQGVINPDGTVVTDGFFSDAFPYNLWNTYYDTSGNGRPGTYTRSGNGTQNSPYIWTKQ